MVWIHVSWLLRLIDHISDFSGLDIFKETFESFFFKIDPALSLQMQVRLSFEKHLVCWKGLLTDAEKIA